MSGLQYPVRVVETEAVTATVRRVRLMRCDGEALPPYSAGSHIVVTLTTADKIIRNAYSLLAATLGGGAYEIAVQRSPQSRGGSAFVHGSIAVGTELAVSAPVNLFAINRLARRHVLLAGGIGITPIAAMAEELAAMNAPFELHYAMRDKANDAFATALVARHGAKVRLYVSQRQERIVIRDILEHQPLGTHLYVCGPDRMTDPVLDEARHAGWPEASLHAERFVAAAGGEPFTVRLARSDIVTTVGEQQTLLEAIEEAGVDAPCLCRGGACGQCETTVLAAEGEILHEDHYLSPRDKAQGDKIMICVSRLKGRLLVLDL